jgi:hypothetical protein
MHTSTIAPLLLHPSRFELPPQSEDDQLALLEPGEAALDEEALIREARRRQRRRWAGGTVAFVLLAAIGVAAWQLAFSQSSSATHAGHEHTPARLGLPPTLTFHLLGWGTVVQGYSSRSSCPDGVTSVPIRSSAGQTVGSMSECDLVVSKVDKPNWGVWSTHANMLATYHAPGGTIDTHEQRTFRFSRSQIHTTGSFTGRITGGSGRYAHARGSVTGGGPGGAKSAHWTVVFHFH